MTINTYLIKTISITLLLSTLLTNCTRRVIDANNNNPSPSDSSATVLVSRQGQTDRFEIATWNIENFPKADPGNRTQDNQILTPACRPPDHRDSEETDMMVI